MIEGVSLGEALNWLLWAMNGGYLAYILIDIFTPKRPSLIPPKTFYKAKK